MNYSRYVFGLNVQTYKGYSVLIEREITKIVEKNQIVVLDSRQVPPMERHFDYALIDEEDFFCLEFLFADNSYTEASLHLFLLAVLERIQKDRDLLFIGESEPISEEEVYQMFQGQEEELDQVKKELSLVTI